jgi:hypothetical protein
MRIPKYENWVQGSKYVVNDINNKDIRGEYDLTIADKKYKWIINGDIETLNLKLIRPTLKVILQTFGFQQLISNVIKSSDSTQNIHSLNRIYRGH